MASFKEYYNRLHVGVVGYSDDSKFDSDVAKEEVSKAFDQIAEEFGHRDIVIVSGLTAVGIPKIAYDEAVKREWTTAGITAKEAEEYDLYDVDEKFIVNGNFGDESLHFLDRLDVLLKFGGGEQSENEAKIAREDYDMEVREFDV